MAPPTTRQQLWRGRFERVIGVAAPLFDLVLSAGDRVSRAVGGEDDPVAIRPPSETFELRSSPRRREGDGAKPPGR